MIVGFSQAQTLQLARESGNQFIGFGVRHLAVDNLLRSDFVVVVKGLILLHVGEYVVSADVQTSEKPPGAGPRRGFGQEGRRRRLSFSLFPAGDFTKSKAPHP